MSVFAYAEMVKQGERRQRARIGRTKETATTTETNGSSTSKIVTAVAALVPAEILAVHAAILGRTTTMDEQGTTTITNAPVLQWSLPFLLLLAIAIFVFTRGGSHWGKVDIVRMLIPCVAFLVWMALIGTSALSPWIAKLPQAMRANAPDALFVGAVITAAFLIAINGKVNPSST